LGGSGLLAVSRATLRGGGGGGGAPGRARRRARGCRRGRAGQAHLRAGGTPALNPRCARRRAVLTGARARALRGRRCRFSLSDGIGARPRNPGGHMQQVRQQLSLASTRQEVRDREALHVGGMGAGAAIYGRSVPGRAGDGSVASSALRRSRCGAPWRPHLVVLGLDCVHERCYLRFFPEID
jgi:hypothetical protein